MRELTEAEKGDLRYGCVFCASRLFHLGPQGGLAFNIYCVECLAGFNVTHAKLPWQLISPPDTKTYDELAPILDGRMSVLDFFQHLDEAIERGIRSAFDRIKPPSNPK